MYNMVWKHKESILSILMLREWQAVAFYSLVVERNLEAYLTSLTPNECESDNHGYLNHVTCCWGSQKLHGVEKLMEKWNSLRLFNMITFDWALEENWK